VLELGRVLCVGECYNSVCVSCVWWWCGGGGAGVECVSHCVYASCMAFVVLSAALQGRLREEDR